MADEAKVTMTQIEIDKLVIEKAEELAVGSVKSAAFEIAAQALEMHAESIEEATVDAATAEGRAGAEVALRQVAHSARMLAKSFLERSKE